METIRFTYNWNTRGKGHPGKLDLKAFTTLRLKNENKYKVGELYRVVLEQGKEEINKGIFQIIDIRIFLLKNINHFVALIDTGYDIETCQNMIKKMYQAKAIDWETQELMFIILHNVSLPENA